MGLDNPIHIAFLLLLLLLVFGAKRLPELGRSLGTGMRGFKESLGGEGAPPQLSGSELVSNGVVPAPASVVPAPAVTVQQVPVADPSTHQA